MQAVASRAKISLRVLVWLDPDGFRRATGHLTATTEAGITLEKPGGKRPPRFVPRGEARMVRLVRVDGEKLKRHPYRWHIGAAIAAVSAQLAT